MHLVVLLISILLFFVLFFGIGFILNMLLRMSWVMAVVYPIVAILIVDKVSFSEYFTDTKAALFDLGTRISHLAAADIIILVSGFLGAITAGIVIKMLRRNGYQMF